MTVILLVLMFNLAVSTSGYASGVAIAWRISDPPVIDGDLSEWIKDNPVFIGSEEQLNSNPEYWSGLYDNSGTLYLAWDPENLYLAGEIFDDSPFVWFMGNGLDGNDGLGLYLSTDPNAVLGRPIYDSTDFRLLFGLDNDMFATGIDRSNVLIKKGIETAGVGGYENTIKGCKIAIKQTELGFNLEIKIPLASLSNDRITVLRPEPCMEVGFNLELYDLDQSCPGAVASGLVWKTGNPRISPRDWGILKFEDR